jgi:hypothetical protein
LNKSGAGAREKMKSYIIVNESELLDTPYFGVEIPKNSRPSFIHLDKEQALDEITRLKRKSPECSFTLYESIAHYGQKDKCLKEETA